MRQLTACVLLLVLAPHSTLAAAESPTPPLQVSTQTNFTFFVCGDNRGGDEVYTQILAQASTLHAAFLISTGDLVRNGTDVCATTSVATITATAPGSPTARHWSSQAVREHAYIIR